MSDDLALSIVRERIRAGAGISTEEILEAAQRTLAQEPRRLLPLLEDLDKRRDHGTLRRIVDQVRSSGALPLEAAIFALRIHFRDDEHEEALSAASRVLTLSPHHAEALRTAGRIAGRTKQEDLSLSYWERLAECAPADQEAALQAARIHFRRGHYSAASAHAIKAAQYCSDPTEALSIAVRSGLETGWASEYNALLQKLSMLERPSALKVTSRLILDLPCEEAAHLLKTLMQGMGDEPKFANIINQACSTWTTAALEHELASRELQAASYYRALCLVRPNDPRAKKALDELTLPSLVGMRDAFGDRRFEDAIGHGIVANQLDPGCVEAWQTLGRAYFALGRYVEARDAFAQCTELSPQDANTWLAYGLTLNQSGDRRAALEAFRKVMHSEDLGLHSEARASISALHPFLVHDAHEAAARGDEDTAWRNAEAAASIAEDRSISVLKQKLQQQLREQIRAAWNANDASTTDLCRRYIGRDAKDTFVLTVYARMLMRLRSYTGALSVWEMLAQQAPDDSHLWLQIARCCRALKLWNKGIEAAETALRLEPALDEARDIADALRAGSAAPG